MTAALPKSRVARQLARLNAIACGPGAVRVPPSVVGVHLSFKFQYENGHMGPRKFWRENLPQVQFHNPGLSISVERKYANSVDDTATIPAHLSIKFQDGKEQVINVQHKHSNEILKSFIEATGATVIPVEEQPVLKREDRRAARK